MSEQTATSETSQILPASTPGTPEFVELRDWGPGRGVLLGGLVGLIGGLVGVPTTEREPSAVGQ